MEVQAQASRTLEFLQVIEATIVHLTNNTSILRNLASELQDLRDSIIQSTGPVFPDDAESRTVTLLDKSADAARRIYEAANAERDVCARSGMVKDEDGLVDAYDGIIDAARLVHDLSSETRDAILVNAGLHAQRGSGVYEVAEALMADILAGR